MLKDVSVIGKSDKIIIKIDKTGNNYVINADMNHTNINREVKIYKKAVGK